ncbi:MAG: hypothetical protein AB8G77_02020 [Rhodothermales bacterium]
MIQKTTSTIAIAATVFLSLSQIAHADNSKNFQCSRIPFLSDSAKAAISKLSHNRTMKVIVKEYALQWENEEIRRTCDAAVAGKKADFSCFESRRDWDAIASMIPSELTTLDRKALRPHQLKLQATGINGKLRNEALEYCEGLGVIDRKVKG